MPETLHATVVAANNGCVSPANALGAPDGTFTGNTSNTGWDCRWSLDDPPGPLEGVQTVHLRCRKETAGGNGDPAVTVELWDSDSFVRALATDVSLTDASTPLGTDVGGSFDASEISGVVQVRCVPAPQGGSPAGRRNVQVDAALLVATVGTTQQNETGGSDTSISVGADGSGQTAEHPAGGADVTVIVAASGGGSAETPQHEAGGSTATIVVAAGGGGRATESVEGGSDGSVSVAADGSGQAAEVVSGGTDAVLIVQAVGAGVGIEDVRSGSDTAVTITATGGGFETEDVPEGQQQETGGSDAGLTVTGSGGGFGTEHAAGGNDATVIVYATGQMVVPARTIVATWDDRRPAVMLVNDRGGGT